MSKALYDNPFRDELSALIRDYNNILRSYVDNRGIIEDTDMLNRLEEMTKRKQLEFMKRAVSTVNHRKVSVNKRGYYQILVDESSNRITAKTEYDLYLKLYERYFGTFREIDPAVEDVFEEYQEWRLNYDTCCKATVDQDLQTWNKYLKNTALAKTRISIVKPKDIMNEYRLIMKNNYLTRKAFNKISCVINGVFRYACMEMDNPPIEINVARSVDVSKMKFKPENDNSNDVYTEDEKIAICNALKNDPSVYAYAVRFAFEFCMRISELRALKWSDYDETRGTIYIHHMMRRENGCISVDTPHTKGSRNEGMRYYPVSAEAKAILDELKELTGNSEYIFANGNGINPISTNKFNAKLEKVCRKVEVRYLSSHKIRFYMITRLYQGNVPEMDIQYLAGHTDATMTRHYRRIHTNAETIRNDLAKIIPFDEVSVRYQSDKPRKVL